MKKLTTILFLALPVMAFSQREKENNPGKTETVSTATTNGLINLINPAEGKQLDAAEATRPILFRWSPVVPKPQTPVTYRLKVWQLMQGQNGTEAMRSNQPIVTKDVVNITQAAISGLYTGPCKPPYLCDFIWAVEALNSNDKESGKSFGRSSAFTFKVTETKTPNAKSQGDPIHGVDIKLGFGTKSQCDPIHGVDIKLGVIARNANGDPVQGVDIKPVVTATNANGDPVHGVDVKLGAIIKTMNANGDPVHGVDVKLGVKSASANGDPVHGVDVKLGFEGKSTDLAQIQTVDIIATVRAANANGDPVHGVDVKLGAVAKKANGDPVHGVDVKLGLKNMANGDPVHGVDVKLGAAAKKEEATQPNNFPQAMRPHAMDLPIEKIIYDASGNIIEIVLRSKDGAPVPKIVVTGSNSLSGGAYRPGQPSFGEPIVHCITVYCHNPLHPPGCGWQECK